MQQHQKIILANGTTFELMVADTFIGRARGLFFRKPLKHNEGLWITPCHSVHTLFMSRAIDVIFLCKQNRIQKIKQNLKPYSFAACKNAYSVIEVETGNASALGFIVGDKVHL